MEFVHEPVLLNEVLEWMDVKEDGVYADGTLGGGGHSGAMLRKSGGTARLFGIDRDLTAIAAASERLKEFPGFRALHGNFHDGKTLLEAADAPLLDGVLLDLGVSSPQLDVGERGFSYHEDAPLDMRMDRSQGITAAELCGICEKDKAAISRTLAELEEAGMITRLDPNGKRYRSRLYLTEQGKMVAKQVDDRVHQAVSQVSEGYDVKTREIFVHVLNMIADNLQELSKKGLQENCPET